MREQIHWPPSMLYMRASKWRIQRIISLGSANDGVQWSRYPLLRHYASTANPPSVADTPDDAVHRGRDARRMFFQGSITTSSPSTTPLHALLRHLGHYRSIWAHQRSNSFREAILLLLLTPSYARHALDLSFPLRAFENMSGDRNLVQPLEVVTAVVDAVPGSRLGEEGKEGIVYLYQQFAQDEPKSSTETASMTGRTGEWRTSNKPKPHSGELTFTFNGLATGNVAEEKLPGRITDGISYSVSLPLAQTLFTTGRETTMQLARYVPNPDQSHRLECQSREELQSARLSLPFTREKPAAALGYHVRASFPLTPLTPARKVKDCLGNVIKSVSSYASFGQSHHGYNEVLGEDEGKEAAIQPASQELEVAISTHFAQQNMLPSPVEVYALIIPYARGRFATRDKTLGHEYARMLLGFSREKSKDLAPSMIDQAIQELITVGNARLCKVMSGGGGWGEKKGLLSLDPDSYGPVEKSHGSRGKGSDISGQQSQGQWNPEELFGLGYMKAVVESGENIMFFLAESEPAHNSSASASDTTQAASQGRDGLNDSRIKLIDQSAELCEDDRAVFGVVRSKMDAMPASASNDSSLSFQNGMLNANTPSKYVVEHVPHLFGAFSAAPLTLVTSRIEALRDGPRNAPALDHLHSPTKLGVVGFHMNVERKLVRTPHWDGVESSRSIREESTPEAVIGSEQMATTPRRHNAWDPEAAEKPRGIATQHGLSALGRNDGGSRHYSQKAGTGATE